MSRRRRELARADRVLAGLWRLRLPLPWPAVPHVNAFAVAAGNGVVLVDCGLSEPGSLSGLRQALGQAGLSLDHVRLLVCTHAHADHYGQAAAIVEETGCELWMNPNHGHTTDAAQHPDRILQWRLEVARHSGTPLNDLEEYESTRRGHDPGLSGIVIPERDLTDGVEVESDLGTWQAYETPGHAPSHVVLHQPEHGLLLSGDHLLGRVSLYYDHGYTPDPAGEFLSSLGVVEELEISLVLAGHGRPVRDAPGLIAANRRTIGARLDAIRAALAGGPRAAYDLVDAVLAAADLPAEIPTFARVSWIFPETLCYLTHLERGGEVSREEDGDRELWRLR
ncbi:MAG: MBL fold metallo-hydrolase [Actinomycetota bacterium]|nr:MBL fold metallo-hydrolase [Actinomycetota bacterium]MDQ3648533.1 MBL fold metallo-hydrolase [Actinomycetota bacterium]